MIKNTDDTRDMARKTIDFAMQRDLIMAGFNTLIFYLGMEIINKY
jgi:hypothetical protein